MAMNIGIARASANAADVCGDAAQAWTAPDQVVVAIADGLGHGAEAAAAAQRAMEHVGGHPDCDLPSLFRGMDKALAQTRGAAVGVAVVRPERGELTYAAVGNIRAGLFGWRIQRFDGDAGVVGGGFRRLSPQTFPIRPGDRLVLWTDGLAERLTLAPAAGEGSRDLALDLLHRFSLGRDDACVVVARLDKA